MAYNIKVTTTKPNDKLWYHASGISGAAQVLSNIKLWNETQPGYISANGVFISSDIYEYNITFDSEINGSAWMLGKQTEPKHMVRDAYLAGLPITQETVITGQ